MKNIFKNQVSQVKKTNSIFKVKNIEFYVYYVFFRF